MRVVVGLSGGVDSAVAAWLLKSQGHEVHAIFMKNWEDDDDQGYCSANEDFVDAAAVADVLGIELEFVNFAKDYKDRVFAEFLKEYQAGRTPNPDVLCNAEIKFKAFLDHALRLGAEKIATGHYARVRQVGTQFELLRGVDASKDQSYFLHRLTQAQLSKTLFPVGEMHKTELRALALSLGLPNAKKKDSTGICFIGERPFRAFLNQYIAHQPGPIKDLEGRVLGQHVGLSFYTLGQRQGLGIGGIQKAAVTSKKGGLTQVSPLPTEHHEPWFVAAKDLPRNTLVAVQGHDHPALLSRQLLAKDLSWVSGERPDFKRLGQHNALTAKTRYRQQDAHCFAIEDDTLALQDELTLSFEADQWAVTPGQSVVLYHNEVCLGGGVIWDHLAA
jgi:tRNA-specific 2-thiouridylase